MYKALACVRGIIRIEEELFRYRQGRLVRTLAFFEIESGYLRKMVFGFILFILMALQIPRWRCALLILLCHLP